MASPRTIDANVNRPVMEAPFTLGVNVQARDNVPLYFNQKDSIGEYQRLLRVLAQE